MVELLLGYLFHDITLLNTALCHSSYVHEQFGIVIESNERLEFLGDAVLDLIVTNLLFQCFPLANEGQLSRARSRIVNEASLAIASRKLGLGDYLLLGQGEKIKNGSNNPSILANILEAIMAAIFLDSSLVIVKQIFEDLIGSTVEKAVVGAIRKDYKTCLQEQVQGNLHLTPHYNIISAEGPEHKKKFKVVVKINGQSVAEGCGQSRKEAEQDAAQRWLCIWNV